MTHIIIIAKQPLPGFAKTRLIPALGETGAAQLAEKMLHHAVDQAYAADVGPVLLNYTPNSWQVDQFTTKVDGMRFVAQSAGDLGERMSAACRQVYDGQPDSSVLLMGTDCPGLTDRVLRQMHLALNQRDACLVPANDGGYVALAMRKYNAHVFSEIAWSSESVAESTRQRMRDLGWQWSELPALVDIDEPSDLVHLPAFLAIKS